MTLCSLHEIILPITEQGFGIEVEAPTHRITVVHPGGPAHSAGMMVGDMIMALGPTVVTDIQWSPGPDEGTFYTSGDFNAIIPATEALPQGATEVSFKVLRPFDEKDFAAAPAPVITKEEIAAAEAEIAQIEAAQAAPSSAPYPTSGTVTRDPYHEARLHYPWATEMKTHDGAVKNKYNMVHGTVLQPLQAVVSTHEAQQRKMAFAANGRVSGAVGMTHGASGLGYKAFGK